jgi:hypothetical protein
MRTDIGTVAFDHAEDAHGTVRLRHRGDPKRRVAR